MIIINHILAPIFHRNYCIFNRVFRVSAFSAVSTVNYWVLLWLAVELDFGALWPAVSRFVMSLSSENRTMNTDLHSSLRSLKTQTHTNKCIVHVLCYTYGASFLAVQLTGPTSYTFHFQPQQQITKKQQQQQQQLQQ